MLWRTSNNGAFVHKSDHLPSGVKKVQELEVNRTESEAAAGIRSEEDVWGLLRAEPIWNIIQEASLAVIMANWTILKRALASAFYMHD